MDYSNTWVFGGRPRPKVGAARRRVRKQWVNLPEGRRVKKEYRVYKYMHIYLCNTLTLRFLEVGPARRRGGQACQKDPPTADERGASVVRGADSGKRKN
jgi:hypothetical protein